jgi:hypothetical protein
LQDSGIYRETQPVSLDAPARRQLMHRLESSLEGIV